MGKLGKVKVKSVTEVDPNNPVNPMLLRFEHAAVNPNLNGSTDLNRIFGTAVFQSEIGTTSSRDMSHLNRSAFESASRESRGSKRKQVVALQSDAMTYIGTKGFDNPMLPQSTEDRMKTYVALKHKKKMRIFEVTPVTVSPYLEGHSYVVEKPRDTNIKKTGEERKAAGFDLVKAFGSKKKRLTYERLEKNKIDASDMQMSIDAAIDKMVEVSTETELVTRDESVLTLIPPCNREVGVATEVYKLEDIIKNSELDAMDELVQSLLNASPADLKKWRSEKKFSDYFFSMWIRLQPRKDDARSVKIAKIVLYTELLIIFLKLKHAQIRKKNVELPHDFPLWMREKVVDNFTVMNANGSRNRPDAYKDKTCCYIMVLVLLANDLIFDVHLMSTSLNIHIKKLLTLAKAVGITVVYNPTSKDYRASLKMPLPKPIEKRGRRRNLR